MGFVLRIHVPAKAPRGEDARLFAARLAFRDDDDVLRSDDMMMKEKSGSRYDSSVSTFADVDVLFARSTKAARVLSLSLFLSLSLVLERGIQRVTHKRKVKKIIQSREIFFFFPKQTEEEEKEKR